MLMRSIVSTLILSSVVASAIALAQSPKKATARATPQLTEEALAETTAEQDGAEEDAFEQAGSDRRRAPKRGSSDVLYNTQPYSNRMLPIPSPARTATFPDARPGSVDFIREYRAQALSPEEIKEAQEFGSAVEELRQAESVEQKAAAREHLNAMISAQLDRDFERREQKLAEIEARAKELRDQLEHRRNSKEEIQKMLLMLIENPEAGLGLPPAWMNSVMRQPITILSTPPASFSGPSIAPPAPAVPPQR